MKLFGILGMFIGIMGIGDLIIKIGHMKELISKDIFSILIFGTIYIMVFCVGYSNFNYKKNTLDKENAQ